MREAMAEAEVGDDVYGEDPDGRARSRRGSPPCSGTRPGCSRPSGSMANQLGMRLHVAPGEELLADSLAHVVRAELGAARRSPGITIRTWVAAARACSTPAAAAGADARPSAGAVPGLHRGDRGREHAQLRRRHGAAARGDPRSCARRLASAASRCTWTAPGCGTPTSPPASRSRRTASCSTRSSVCLSQGARRAGRLGARRVGASAMAEARVWRKRYGGGMRQAGILAAAGRYALDHHRRPAGGRPRPGPARGPGGGRGGARRRRPRPGGDEHRHPRRRRGRVVGRCLRRGRRSPRGADVRPDARSVRLVWHLDVDDAATAYAADVVTTMICEEAPRP